METSDEEPREEKRTSFIGPLVLAGFAAFCGYQGGAYLLTEGFSIYALLAVIFAAGTLLAFVGTGLQLTIFKDHKILAPHGELWGALATILTVVPALLCFDIFYFTEVFRFLFEKLPNWQGSLMVLLVVWILGIVFSVIITWIEREGPISFNTGFFILFMPLLVAFFPIVLAVTCPQVAIVAVIFVAGGEYLGDLYGYGFEGACLGFALFAPLLFWADRRWNLDLGL